MTSFNSNPVELYVAQIPGETTEQELKDFFEKHEAAEPRNVTEAFFVSKAKGSTGFGKRTSLVAILRLGSHAQALDAKVKLNRARFKGQAFLNVRWSQSQRVLWVGRLHDTVTNEHLLVAFSQFGTVERAFVAADPQKGASKCYGFVVFGNKKDAQKALQRCTEEPFSIGPTLKPIKVEYTRLEDGETGFTDEMWQGKKAATPEASTISRFFMKNSMEHKKATRLAELEAEYCRLKASMKAKLMEIQTQVMLSAGPPAPINLLPALAQDPSFGGGFLLQRGAPLGPMAPLGHPPGSYPGAPRPAMPPHGAPPQYVPKPQPPVGPIPGYAPPGPRPPPGGPPPGLLPGPRPPPGGPLPAAAYSRMPMTNKRVADIQVGQPPAKAQAVDYGSGIPSATVPPGQHTLAQALSYASQNAPADPADPYAAYRQQQQYGGAAPATAPPAAQPAQPPAYSYPGSAQPQAAAPPASHYPSTYETQQYQQSSATTQAPSSYGYQPPAAAADPQAEYQQQVQAYHAAQSAQFRGY